MDNKYLSLVAESVQAMREHWLKSGMNERISGIDALAVYMADRLGENLAHDEGFNRSEFLAMCRGTKIVKK